MPRTEARIFTSIWNDPHFLSLDVSAQRLYFFLLSQDDLTTAGSCRSGRGDGGLQPRASRSLTSSSD